MKRPAASLWLWAGLAAMAAGAAVAAQTPSDAAPAADAPSQQMQICAASNREIRAASDDLAALLDKEIAKEKSAPPAGPPDGAAPAAPLSLPVAPVLAQAKMDMMALKSLSEQASKQLEIAQATTNPALRQVAMKDATLKMATAQRLADSIRSGLGVVQRTAVPDAQPASSLPSAQPPHRIDVDALLKQLKIAAQRSQEGVGASGESQAAMWAQGAFGEGEANPGGILFSRSSARQLALRLEVRGVSYDAARKELTLVGDPSAAPLDIDLFATALRMALDDDEPYFSLDPVAGSRWPLEWDAMADAISARLATPAYALAAFPCPSATDGAVAPWAALPDAAAVSEWCGRAVDANTLAAARAPRDRFLAMAIPGRPEGDEQPFQWARLAEFDPALERELVSAAAVDMNLTFHPEWLRKTRLGEIVFRADASLKELFAPYSLWSADGKSAIYYLNNPPRDNGHEFDLGSLFGLHGIRRIDPFAALNSGTGKEKSFRLWFAPGAAAVTAGAAIDVSRVIPLLQIVTQVHMEDSLFSSLPALYRAQRDDVNTRFAEYARVKPEWRQLAEVFRYFVLGVWLRENAPDFARMLRAELPEPLPPSRALPPVHKDLVAIAIREAEEESDGGWRWSVPVVEQGGVSFAERQVKIAPGDTPVLRAAAGGADNGLRAVRLRLPATPLDEALAKSPTPRGAGGIEADLTKRYDDFRHRLASNEGGLWRALGGAANPDYLVVLWAASAAIVALAGRISLGRG